MSNENKPEEKKLSRRSFLSKAAAGTAGAAALGFPMISVAQSPITMRWQSTWPAKDIFHEYAQDFASRVNGMSGGRLKIEVLPAGAVVKAFDLLDAVSKGTLDGGHGVVAYWYGKNSAVALWGSGPAYGMDPNMVLAWHNYGGGKQMLDDIYKNAVVLITDKYVHDEDDFPAGSAAVALFEAISKKGWHQVRLIDATGQPYEEKNVARDDFEKAGIARLKAGDAVYEQVVEVDGQRQFRALTPLPVVMKKCVMCHAHYADAKENEPIGAISYSVPVE